MKVVKPVKAGPDRVVLRFSLMSSNCVRLVLLFSFACAWRSPAQMKAVSVHSPAAKKINALVEKFDRPGVPGVNVAVYRAGKIEYSRAAGMADLEHDVPLRTDSVFNIASMSKQFTAMALVLLQEDGLVSLDDAIGKYLPEMRGGVEKVTIRQLLHHTSGIRDYLDLMELAGENPESRVVSQADVLNILSAQDELNFKPGDAFRYENSSYALMATVVQRVSGKSLRQFATERIFAPLHMSSTQFRDDHTDLIPRRACGYEPRKEGWSGVTPIYDEVGDGGVWTTIEDLAKWDGNFYRPTVGGDDGRQLLVSEATLNSGRKISYALGLFVQKYRGCTMVSHGGVDPGYRAQMLRFPDERLTVAVLSNNPAYDVEGLARSIADLYLPKVTESVPVTPAVTAPSRHEWAEFIGRYLDESTGRIREIVAGKESLTLRSRGKDYPFVDVGGNGFRGKDDKDVLVFEKTEKGDVQMTLSADGETPSVSKKLPSQVPPWVVSDYSNAYSNAALGVTWRIESSGQDLALVRLHRKESLTPVDKDEFVSDTGLIHFMRDGHQVVAFKVTNVRDTNVEFRSK